VLEMFGEQRKNPVTAVGFEQVQRRIAQQHVLDLLRGHPSRGHNLVSHLSTTSCQALTLLAITDRIGCRRPGLNEKIHPFGATLDSFQQAFVDLSVGDLVAAAAMSQRVCYPRKFLASRTMSPSSASTYRLMKRPGW